MITPLYPGTLQNFYPQYGFGNPSSSGNTQLLPGVAGKSIFILSMVVISSAGQNVKFQSNTTDISATFPVSANGGFSLPFSNFGWFATNQGEALNANLSANSQAAISFVYIYV
jgi:hypothetical protein